MCMKDEKKELWKEAIEINSADGNPPSEILKILIKENIENNLTTEEIIERLKEYYEEK